MGYIPLSNFFIQNLAWMRESQVSTITPIFTFVALKMWVYAPPKSSKMVIFGKFLPRLFVFVTLSNYKVCDNRNAMKQCNFQNNYGTVT